MQNARKTGPPDGVALQSIIFDADTMDIVCLRTGDRMDPLSRTAFNINQRVVQHSPTGFEWGYHGSGPADFALNVLDLFIPPNGVDDVQCFYGKVNYWAWILHQDFKRKYIASMAPQGGTIIGSDIRHWINEMVAILKASNHTAANHSWVPLLSPRK